MLFFRLRGRDSRLRTGMAQGDSQQLLSRGGISIQSRLAVGFPSPHLLRDLFLSVSAVQEQLQKRTAKLQDYLKTTVPFCHYLLPLGSSVRQAGH